MSGEPDLIIGIDGGGTSTTVWLARTTAATVTIAGKATDASSNIQAVGTERALQALNRAVVSAFENAGIDRQKVQSVCLGCAGADRKSVHSILRRWAVAEHWTDSIEILNDAELVLAAATSQRRGVALIAGTGSLAFGRDATGSTARSGGWGYLLGDEGSAFAIGQTALRKTMSAADGRAASTMLSELICRHFSVGVPTDLVSAIYGAVDPRLAVASVAPLVFDAAAADDSVARTILQTAAVELARLVISVFERLTFENQPALAFAGGVLASQPDFQSAVCHAVSAAGGNFDRPSVIEEPVEGAVAIAAEDCRRLQSS
jgi:N-acetylmuramic acid 6-phosphate etherase